MRVLFFVEGFTDIRFVVGLSEICELTLAVPARAYRDSGLDARLRESGARVTVQPIEGGRLAFQARSFAYLWRAAPSFDVILAQEMLRGALNATLVGALRGVPVVTYMGISPIEYFRCRRERGQIGAAAAAAGRGGHPRADDHQRPAGVDGAGHGAVPGHGGGALQPPGGHRPLLRRGRGSLPAGDAGREDRAPRSPRPPARRVPDRALEPHQPREGSRNRAAGGCVRPRPRPRCWCC